MRTRALHPPKFTTNNALPDHGYWLLQLPYIVGKICISDEKAETVFSNKVTT